MDDLEFNTLLQKKRTSKRENWLNNMLIKNLRGMDKATDDLQSEAYRLEKMVDRYKKKSASENLKNVTLHAQYSTLALNFLQDFQSDATAELYTTIRKQTKTFIYGALFENIAACEKSPAFKELFKLSEGLEFDFWVTERLTQTFLRIQEYLKEAHGIQIESTQLPATENDLFENIRAQFSIHILGFTPESIMIPFTGDEQDEIFKWHIDGCNMLLKRNYYKYAFNFGGYVLGQMELIAQGMGLIRLSNLYSRELRLLKLAAKDGATKDKMIQAVSAIRYNVGEKKEAISYWEKLGIRTQQAIDEIEGGATHALDRIEEEWLKKIVAYKDKPLPQGLVSIFCQLLKGHKEIIVNAKKRINLEGKYIHFFNREENYNTVTFEDRDEMIRNLKKNNQDLEADITTMKSSPDALFQVLQKNNAPQPENDFVSEDQIKTIESILGIVPDKGEEDGENYVSPLLKVLQLHIEQQQKEDGVNNDDENDDDIDDDDDDDDIDLSEFNLDAIGDDDEDDDDDDDDIDLSAFNLDAIGDDDDDDDDDDDETSELEFDLEGYDEEEGDDEIDLSDLDDDDDNDDDDDDDGSEGKLNDKGK